MLLRHMTQQHLLEVAIYTGFLLLTRLLPALIQIDPLMICLMSTKCPPSYTLIGR
jgi:hypothetical protein